MDNLAHSLVGAALAQAGLKRNTGLATATLVIAANLPDVDVLGLFFGENLAWRRGWTHGPIGFVVLPALLAVLMLGFDRWQARRGRRPAGRRPVALGPLLLLAYAGALTHPALDLLNTYGVRLLMPFSERWFYGDTLFIIDLWLWLGLGLGIWLSHRRDRQNRPRPWAPAAISLAAACLYIGTMAAGSAQAERLTADAAAARLDAPVGEAIANPVPINSLRRRMIYRTGNAYGFGDVSWAPAARLQLEPQLLPHNMDDPAIAVAARSDKALRDFLYWSRLPFATVRRDAAWTTVTVSDVRYSDGPTRGRFLVSARIPAEVDPARSGSDFRPR